MMNDLLLVLTIAALAAGLTYLGAPIAERFDLPHRVVSGALQFAAGVVMAIVAFSLMPTAVRNGPWQWIVPAFFVGGVLYIVLEQLSADAFASGPSSSSPGLYIGILIDLVIDGIVIGIGATLTLRTGLLLALGMAVSTMPLAFVTTAIAKRQGVAPQRRQRLAYLFVVAIIGGALLGYLVLRNQPLGARMVLVALASGFLITTVTQGMIPEANKDGESGFAGILFVGGISLYALMALGLQ
jgi:zinc transporter, ZIP family